MIRRHFLVSCISTALFPAIVKGNWKLVIDYDADTRIRPDLTRSMALVDGIDYVFVKRAWRKGNLLKLEVYERGDADSLLVRLPDSHLLKTNYKTKTVIVDKWELILLEKVFTSQEDVNDILGNNKAVFINCSFKGFIPHGEHRFFSCTFDLPTDYTINIDFAVSHGGC